jgi:hypothetical protein
MGWIFEKFDIGLERTKGEIGSVSEFLDRFQFKWEKWSKRVYWIHKKNSLGSEVLGKNTMS